MSQRLTSLAIAALAVFTIVLALRPSPAPPDDPASQLATVKMPEMSQRNLPAPFCVTNVQLAQPDEQRRKAQLLDFIERSYDLTQQWFEKYILLGIDYASYRSFDIVIYRDCTTITEEYVAKIFGGCPSRALSCLSIDQVATRTDASTFALGEPNVASGRMEALIKRHIGTTRLSRCTIKTSVTENRDNQSEALLVYNDIIKLRQKYIFPFMDTPVTNNEIYFILSRHCEHAEKLYSLFLELFQQQSPESAKSLQAPQFDPDVSHYLATVRGTD